MKKIISFIIILAMMLVMVPTVALAAGTKTITTSAELADAILNQADDETWNLAPNTTFTLDDAMVASYASLAINGSSNFIFPITASNLIITGGPGTIVTSSKVVPASEGGNWHWQNFITIGGNNVTLDGLTLIPNENLYEVGDGNPSGVNKIIEVLGSGSTIKNIRTEPRQGDFSGSIYYSNAASGSTDTLENVYLNKGRISLSGKNTGTLNMTNVTIDFVEALTAAPDFLGFQSNTGVTFTAVDVKLMMSQHRMDLYNALPNKPVVEQITGDQNTEVTANAEPVYTIIIPAKVDFGKLTKSMPEQTKSIAVGIENALLEEGASVQVDVTSVFSMKDQAPGSTATLPYQLFNTAAGGSALASGATYCTFTAAVPTASVDGRLTCLPSGLTRAGTYSDTIVFDCSYINN